MMFLVADCDEDGVLDVSGENCAGEEAIVPYPSLRLCQL